MNLILTVLAAFSHHHFYGKSLHSDISAYMSVKGGCDTQ